ncbi:hypothetical protein DFP72DRAFT_1170054 [Ephemerocybe angulata]|uniref:Uncharacterized protein n=1 Tax=Ephemerocybe angulata TaxID=980116 RepID=A0A8H6HYL8_9AGAR|nr:hypothetical protein DFP72DRAFT_1170054 [Tulosesus angulatus]
MILTGQENEGKHIGPPPAPAEHDPGLGELPPPVYEEQPTKSEYTEPSPRSPVFNRVIILFAMVMCLVFGFWIGTRITSGAAESRCTAANRADHKTLCALVEPLVKFGLFFARFIPGFGRDGEEG